MKQISIKHRVIFWYAFSLFVFLLLIFLILIQGGSHAAADDARRSLTVATDMAVNNVSVIDGQLEIDDDFIYYIDNTWVVLYREDGVVISGLVPEGFPQGIAFEEDRIQSTGQGSGAWYVYDRRIENQAIGTVWIRGMTPAALAVRNPAISRMLWLLRIVLPVMLILSLAGGWMITRRAFAPLKEMTETVARIQEGSDLSGRVRMTGDPGTKDEIQATAAAFDRMLDRIQESFEREKRFTDDASHELRTPTAVIRAECDYALENSDRPEEVRESLEVIRRQSAKMASLLDQLLMLARADRGAVSLNRERTDISLLAEEAAMALRREAEQKQMALRVRAQEGIYAEADASLLGRAMENLLSNAIRYGRTGGTAEISVERDEAAAKGPAGQEKAQVVIRVRDDGIGIAPEEQERIWERFYRVDASRETDGMGLGLPLVKWIAEAHGGTVSLTSAPGAGSVFTLNVPEK